MNGMILKAKITSEGKSISEVLELLREEHGIKMGRTTFYRKMYGRSEFDRKEILVLSRILNLSDAEMLEIFFVKEVS